MVVACRMRYWLHGSGDEDENEQLVVVNVHLNCNTAKQAITHKPAVALKKFWDELVEYIVEFRARMLVGDFNMALWLVIPELRARGLQVNLATWYPFRQDLEPYARIDSNAMFIIGPVVGIRKVHDVAALGLLALDLGIRGGGVDYSNWKLVEEVQKNADGSESRRPTPVTIF